MKKIFTLLLCAVVCIGSCWGTEVTVPSTTSATTTEFPFGYRAYGSICQQLYLASELGGASNAGNISSISFKYNANGNTSQNVTLYITTTTSNTLSGFIAPGESQFSGTYTMTKNSWNSFDNLSFLWDGTSNIVITIIDSDAETRASNPMYSYTFSGYNTDNNRGYYVQYEASTKNIPTGNNIVGVSGTVSQTIAQAKFTFEAAELPHEHDGKTWTKTTTIPTSAGNYYLANNITLSENWSPVNGINLCLNGKTITCGTYKLIIGSNVTFGLYDEETGGKITSSCSSFTSSGTIQLTGGTLSLNGGTIENNGSGTYAYGINADASSTINLKGSPIITSTKANFKLNGFITIVGALTNTTKYSVSRTSGYAFTYGWSTNMSGKQPKDYFSSANTSAPYVILEGNEAQLSATEPATSVSIGEDGSDVFTDGTMATATISRAQLYGGMYNTLCLPFDITKTALETVIGSSTVLTLSESDFEDEAITLTFSTMPVNGSLEHGKPYLVKPNTNITLSSFNNVTLYNGTTTTTTTYVDFIPLLSPTALPQSKEILFMGQNNELFWPTEAGTLKGLRCYFQVKNLGSNPSGAPVRMVINKDNTVTNIVDVNANANVNRKVMLNGQLIIIRDGVKFNAQGSRL